MRDTDNTVVESKRALTEPIEPTSEVNIPVGQLNALLERNTQLEKEKRRSFWYQLNQSLHHPGDRLTWSMVFFVITIGLTLPFLPGGAAFVLSGMVAGGWTIFIHEKKD